MKKIIFSITFIVVVAIGLFIGYKFMDKMPTDSEEDKQDVEKTNTIEDKVNYQMEHLSLDEKIGQMLIVYYNGTEMDDYLRGVLQKNKPGGFILFSNNITSYDKTLKFINDIQSTAEIPMFISVDQEGGIVQRFKTLDDVNFTAIPPMLELGKTKDSDLAYDVGKVIAEELRVFGVNVDFAPVIDVLASENSSFIGNRSFGTDKDLVAKMGTSLAKGLSDNGVIPVYKHFPGHGSTVTDSHYDLPVITKTKEELLQSDLYPFKEAIDSGAKIIMIGHLAVPSIAGDDTPASLSKEIITDLLKKEMGYDGLVVTDALNMGALTNNYQEREIYEMAINAGVDLLLMPKNSTSALQLIKESIVRGTITEEQINNSVRKILTLKYELLQEDNKLNKDILASDEHQQIIQKING